MNKLFVKEDGTKVILYWDGPVFGVKIIEPNNFKEGTDEYNNKEIDDWQEIHKYIKSEQNAESEIKNHEIENI